MARKTTQQIEFGDFQTPGDLAEIAAAVVAKQGFNPASIVEPTCGAGSFLFAALRQFSEARQALGLEIAPDYLRLAEARLRENRPRQAVDLQQGDFFSFDWPAAFERLPEPILVIGNPPWVTASQLGALGGNNLPNKTNFQNRRGIEALTGKSNFDIAEWMVGRLLEWLSGRRAVVAMLLKTSVARKVLSHAWKSGTPLVSARMYLFDAGRHFNVAASACFLTCELGDSRAITSCDVFDLDAPNRRIQTIAYRDGALVADSAALKRYEHLEQHPAQEPLYRWRSGVKHDCSRVMELRLDNAELVNGFGEVVDIEDTYVFPMLKSSSVANGGSANQSRYMIVTQKETSEPTDHIAAGAPRTWAYLCEHGRRLDRRGSSIYRKRPRFSVFGIGPYTFTPWKVAVSGLYKNLRFSVVGPRDGKAVVLDDTAYHLSCDTEEEARLLASMLLSEEAQTFLRAFIFWDAKRPVTVEVLQRLNILALAESLGRRDTLFKLRPNLAGRLPTEMLWKTCRA